ncbi:unnamed protein product [Merluccius merluccius]
MIPSLQSAAVQFSQRRDAAWLSQINENKKPLEWAGFNAQQDRLVADSAQKPKTLVVFGPMINSPPAHPDTVLTTLVYLERTLNTFGHHNYARYLSCETGDEEKPHGGAGEEEKNKHKEEGEARRRLDEADRRKIGAELEKYTHPINEQHPGVYNICNGQAAPDIVNVQDALAIGGEQSKQFSTSLCSDFHKTIKKKVKSMEALKKAVIVKGKIIYDVEMLFSRLLVLGQQCSVDVGDIFQFELSPVPTALIDEYGCLRKGNKAVTQNVLGFPTIKPVVVVVVGHSRGSSLPV